MRLEELVKATSSEEEAEKFLREKGILKTFTECPKCSSERLGKKRKGGILEETRVSFRKFVLLVKFFILKVPVNRAYKERLTKFRGVG